MSEKPEIPIKNLYYLLCYAWDVLPLSEVASAGSEKFDRIQDLLTKVLLNGIHYLIRRGFHREYETCEEELSNPRGKINLSDSIKRQSMVRRKLFCEYDEFTADVPFNRILKDTMVRLLHCKELDVSLKHELRKLVPLFSNIRRLEPTRRNLSVLKYNRNNQHYKLLMNLCELLYYEMMPTECGRETEFRDFLREERRMAMLFEKFVRNFYRKELPHSEYFVHTPLIQWDCDPDFQNIGLEFLPDMRTDLVVENIAERKQLIIDTKYYPQALRAGNYGAREKLISGNLYQIYTYASNSDYPGKVSAMLLYPTVERELNLQYRIGGHIIQVKTLNLGADWTEIHQRLIELVKTGNHPDETPK